jgi:ribosome-associated translation inhibitor RaiA
MELLLNTSNISQPTIETIEEYAWQKFSKLKKITAGHADRPPVVQISTEFNKHKKSFIFKVVFNFNSEIFVFKIVDKDVRKAIDVSVDNIRKQILRLRGKKWLNTHN